MNARVATADTGKVLQTRNGIYTSMDGTADKTRDINNLYSSMQGVLSEKVTERKVSLLSYACMLTTQFVSFMVVLNRTYNMTFAEKCFILVRDAGAESCVRLYQQP